jgi:hypothetical protein
VLPELPGLAAEEAPREPEPVPGHLPRALEQEQLRQEPEQEPALRQQVQEPERDPFSPEISLIEVAPAVQVWDSPRVRLERVRLPDSQALTLRPFPCWKPALPVVNKTPPEETLRPYPSELSEFVRSLFHLSK